MLVVEPGNDPVLLDFFVEAPGRGGDPSSRAELVPINVSFGDAVQVFNIGAASVGTYRPAARADRGFATVRADPAGRARQRRPRALARDGVELNAQQAYVIEILAGIVTSTPESAALFAPGGRAGWRRRRAPPAGARRRARAAGGRGRGAVLHRGCRRGDRELAVGAGRDADRAGPGGLRGRRSRAGPSLLPRPRGPHKPPAVGGRDPDRTRARHARRAGRPARRSSGSWR